MVRIPPPFHSEGAEGIEHLYCPALMGFIQRIFLMNPPRWKCLRGIHRQEEVLFSQELMWRDSFQRCRRQFHSLHCPIVRWRERIRRKKGVT